MAVVSRYTVALHILTLLAYSATKHSKEYLTSEFIAKSVNTNPVFIRRILSTLSKAGLVNVRHGTGAGWCLAVEPRKISLLNVYEAVEQKELFDYHHSTPNPICPIGGNISSALEPLYFSAEQAMKAELARSSIGDLLTDTMQLSSK
ncbi:Rrf2 family transcriptional regulator [Paenibacillus algorifonticola]|uniref:Rrf2 family transcriptional regulator n=1 Tax=Paenibacillus algorifonticola TaxID=684063 RepID=UPI003D2C361D